MPQLSGRVTLLALVLALPCSLLTGVAPTPAVAAPPVVPVITWASCDPMESPSDDGDECATVPVPLDYDDPTGPTIELDLLRVPATDPDHRIGTLFVNPGGPGSPARGFASYFGRLVPGVVSARFDIVGIDPRGTGPSALAICRSPGQPAAYPSAAFPTTRREATRQIRFDRWMRKACRTGGAPVVDHMTTADTARDLDLVRQAVGDAQLSYYGVSYGTQLGSTYAAMFPDTVRAMILDGVLDPVEWSTGRAGHTDQPLTERIGSGHGAWLALVNALAECDRVGPRRCAIGGHATEVWLDTVRRLRRHPVGGMTYSGLVSDALQTMYSAGQIPRFLKRLGSVHDALVAGRAVPQRSLRPRVDEILPGPYALRAAAPSYTRTINTFAAIACADSDNPRDPRTWLSAARHADRAAPWFGSIWTWISGICAGWPAIAKADRFTGPYAVTTSAPVLVVGNTYDPATPLQGARAVNRLLGGSRLLVLDGWGHGAIGTGPCVGQAYARYLVDGVLPAAGTVCKPRHPLFRSR